MSKNTAVKTTGGDHTPGPWSYYCDKDGNAISVTALEWRICTLNQIVEAREREANARLIAAAPAMHEAIRETLDMEQPELPPRIVKLLSDALNLADGGN